MQGASTAFRSDDEYQRYYARSLAAVMMRTDRVILNRGDITVTAVWDGEEGETGYSSPGWSYGSKIFFDHTNFNTDITTTEGTTVAMAVNYHEAAHVQFTPKDPAQSLGQQWVLAKDKYGEDFAKFVYNIMEDSRIERLWLGIYPNTRPFFQLMLSNEVVSMDKAVREFIRNNHSAQGVPRSSHSKDADDAVGKFLYPLVAGRRYWDKDLIAGIRNMAYDKFGGAFVSGIDAIMREYLKVVYKGRTYNDTAATLYSRMVRLLWDQMETWEKQIAKQIRGGHTTMGGSNSDTQVQAQQEADKSEGQGTSNGSAGGSGGGSDPDGSDPSDDDAGDSEDGSDDNGGQGSGSGAGDVDQKDGKAGSGAGGKDNNTFRLPDVLDRAHDLAREVISDVRKEVTSVVERVVAGSYSRKAIGSLKTTPVDSPVPLEWVAAKNRMVRSWRKIAAKHDPGWENEVASGRLNVRSYMADRMQERVTDFTRAFDQWNPGKEDATKIAVAVAADISHSMREQMGNLGVGFWTIRRSLHEVDVPVEPIVFGDRAWNLEFTRPPAPRHWDALPGSLSTLPTNAIRQAYSFLKSSKRKHKLFICLTDGVWFDPRPSDRIIEQMNHEGFVTCMAYLEDRSRGFNQRAVTFEQNRQAYGHKCQIFWVIKNAAEIANMANVAVTELIKKG